MPGLISRPQHNNKLDTHFKVHVLSKNKLVWKSMSRTASVAGILFSSLPDNPSKMYNIDKFQTVFQILTPVCENSEPQLRGHLSISSFCKFPSIAI